jgi:hypothetical protein
MDLDLINDGVTAGLGALGVAVLALAGKYVPRLVAVIERAVGVDIPDGWERRGLDLAALAWRYSEEWARGKAQSAIESGVDSVTDAIDGAVGGSDKLSGAVDFFKKHAAGPAKRWGEDKIRDVIQAAGANQRKLEAAAEKANVDNLASAIRDVEATVRRIDASPDINKILRGEIKLQPDGTWR